MNNKTKLILIHAVLWLMFVGIAAATDGYVSEIFKGSSTFIFGMILAMIWYVPKAKPMTARVEITREVDGIKTNATIESSNSQAVTDAVKILKGEGYI